MPDFGEAKERSQREKLRERKSVIEFLFRKQTLNFIIFEH